MFDHLVKSRSSQNKYAPSEDPKPESKLAPFILSILAGIMGLSCILFCVYRVWFASRGRKTKSKVTSTQVRSRVPRAPPRQQPSSAQSRRSAFLNPLSYISTSASTRVGSPGKSRLSFRFSSLKRFSSSPKPTNDPIVQRTTYLDQIATQVVGGYPCPNLPPPAPRSFDFVLTTHLWNLASPTRWINVHLLPPRTATPAPAPTPPKSGPYVFDFTIQPPTPSPSSLSSKSIDLRSHSEESSSASSAYTYPRFDDTSSQPALHKPLVHPSHRIPSTGALITEFPTPPSCSFRTALSRFALPTTTFETDNEIGTNGFFVDPKYRIRRVALRDDTDSEVPRSSLTKVLPSLPPLSSSSSSSS